MHRLYSLIAIKLLTVTKLNKVKNEQHHEITICENKEADQPCGNGKANQRLCFTTWIVQCLFFLSLQFPASIHLLCLCSYLSIYLHILSQSISDHHLSSVCVEPVLKPHCWFSQEVAQMLLLIQSRHFPFLFKNIQV